MARWRKVRGPKVPPAVSQRVRGRGQGHAWFERYIVDQGIRWRVFCGDRRKTISENSGERTRVAYPPPS
jgi:hypothetical protein